MEGHRLAQAVVYGHLGSGLSSGETWRAGPGAKFARERIRDQKFNKDAQSGMSNLDQFTPGFRGRAPRSFTARVAGQAGAHLRSLAPVPALAWLVALRVN